jgi:alkyl hydroperoxide reductase subunit AhpC
LPPSLPCRAEIIQFSDRVKEFEAIGVKVAAASVDSKFSHLAWIQTPRSKGGLGKMAIPVIADITKAMARSFGALVEDPADPEAGVALRATYIIDPAGVVRSVQVRSMRVCVCVCVWQC